MALLIGESAIKRREHFAAFHFFFVYFVLCLNWMNVGKPINYVLSRCGKLLRVDSDKPTLGLRIFSFYFSPEINTS